jgi:RNA polymerase sigma-70 factor (ECF subfamily)
VTSSVINRSVVAFPAPAGLLASQTLGKTAITGRTMDNVTPFIPMPNRSANANPAVAEIDLADDLVLMQQIAGGNQTAFRQLMQRHALKATRYCQRHLSDQALAEDQVQQAFLKVWVEAPRWRPDAKFTTWFYRILHNQMIDYFRANRRPTVAIDDEMADELVDTNPNGEQDLITQQRKNTVNAALQSLPERQRQALMLSHYEGFSQREAATILGITESALESLLTRGRAALRQKLLSVKSDLL